MYSFTLLLHFRVKVLLLVKHSSPESSTNKSRFRKFCKCQSVYLLFIHRVQEKPIKPIKPTIFYNFSLFFYFFFYNFIHFTFRCDDLFKNLLFIFGYVSYCFQLFHIFFNFIKLIVIALSFLFVLFNPIRSLLRLFSSLHLHFLHSTEFLPSAIIYV